MTRAPGPPKDQARPGGRAPRKPRADELALWKRVADTVTPMPGRKTRASLQALELASDPAPPHPHLTTGAAVPHKGPPPPGPQPLRPKGPAPRVRPPPAAPRRDADPLEPNRARRVVRERDPIDARIDLHGMTLDQARAALETFVLGCWTRGERTLLVITGKGSLGEGMIRRLAPEWLNAPALRPAIAAIQSAHRRHGGEGAIYVALKARREPG
ncbi:MAG: Smr/MutS family protein [Caulobacter sp.]